MPGAWRLGADGVVICTVRSSPQAHRSSSGWLALVGRGGMLGVGPRSFPNSDLPEPWAPDCGSGPLYVVHLPLGTGPDLLTRSPAID